VVPPTNRPVDDQPLERVAREAAEEGERPHDQRVDELVEVPLVDEHRVHGAEALVEVEARPVSLAHRT
jgi:hypothetical protein